MYFLNFRKFISLSPITVLIFLFFSFSCSELQSQRKYTIVLDAGHGGKDPGASNGKFIEKKIALKVVLEVGKQLKKIKDINVVYTRDKDVFIELHKRATIANKKEADLFVSLHCDSFKPNPKAHGASTYVLGLKGNRANMEIAKRENAVIILEKDYQKNYDYDPNSPESVIGLSVLQEENLDESLRFAGLTQGKFVAVKRKDRSVKQANFLVLRETVMPSVLIELGFLSNYREGKFLNSKEGQKKLATAIAKAIDAYVEQLRINTVALKSNPVAVPQVKQEKENTTLKQEKPKVASTNQVKTVKTVKDTTKKNSSRDKIKDGTNVAIPSQHPVKKVKSEVASANTTKKNKPAYTSKVNKTKTKKTNVVEYRVQIAASKKYLKPKSYNFKGLQNVVYRKIGVYYKYYGIITSNRQEALEHLKQIRKKGFTDAFLVAFLNGKKISVKQAVNIH